MALPVYESGSRFSGNIAANDGDSFLNTLVVKRFDDCFRQAHRSLRLIISHIIAGPIRQVPGYNAVHIGTGGDDFFIGDDNAAAGAQVDPAWKDSCSSTIFGFHSGRASLKMIPGNGRHKRYQSPAECRVDSPSASSFSNSSSVITLPVGFVGRETQIIPVSSPICRCSKSDVVFKLAFRQQFNIRTRRDKQIFFQSGVSIANVFRCKREQHFFDPTIGTASGKQVK
nr:unnamed protein product [Escherichia coli K-12]